MDLSTILFITLAAIFALGFAFFQYLYKTKKRGKDAYILFALRFLSVFVLLLLLINPKFTFTSYTIEKPNLVLAVDDSESIKHLTQEDTLNSILEKLKSNEKIKQRFELVQYNFGNDLKAGENNKFNKSETNIFSALESIKELSRGKETAIALISDGNQTSGRNYQYFKPDDKTNIYPVLVGDTTQYLDLELSRLNVNSYAFLNNRFPVEAFISYSGEESINTKFIIKAGENAIYSKNISLDSPTI